MSETLPDRVARGVAALRAGRPAEAVEALAPVADDPELAAAADLQDVRASVCSLLAQALLDDGRPQEAEGPCREAVRILRRLRDRRALDQVRELQDRIVAAIARDHEQAARLAEQARVAATPTEVLLAGVHDPLARADLLVKKAHAMAEQGDGPGAVTLAGEAMALAGDDVRLRVLACLALARAEPGDALRHLVAARDIADAADEFNLLSLVAHAARVAGVTLPPPAGPHDEEG